MPTSPPNGAEMTVRPERETVAAQPVGAGKPFVVMAKPVGPVCNLNCEYCYYLAKTSLFPPGEHYRMTDEVLEAYVRAFIEASPGPTVHFVWHGGEPTLAGVGFFRRAVELQQRYLPAGWRCLNTLQTNGTLLDGKWCAFLRERRFAVGISVDGPASLHDPSRPAKAGRPSHSRAMRGFDLLRQHGIDPDVLCTVNARNSRAPLEVYRYFLDHEVRWLQFIPVVERPPSSVAWQEQPAPAGAHSVTAEAFGEFLCQIFDEWVRHDVGRIGVQNFLEALLVLSGQPATLCVMSESCGAALALEHDGSVYSCDHFVNHAHRLGNVVTDGLAELARSPQQGAFGKAKRDDLPQSCLECPVLFLCNGGCPKDRLSPTRANYLCAGYRRFYNHALPCLRRMALLAAAGQPVTGIMAQLAPQPRRRPTAGRNDPCPCGSGRKYKLCCGRRLSPAGSPGS